MVVALGMHEVMSPAHLRQQRTQAGLSQSELAAALDVSVSAVKLWETGRRPVSGGWVNELRRVLAARAPVAVPAMTGAELKGLRERAGLSQADVAQLLGVAQPAVTAWERGEVPEARRELLREALAATKPAGAVMRALRERAGWKQAELAERIGATQREVSEWERGAKPVPAERWPAIRDELAAAKPDNERLQQPVTAEELHEGVRALNWTLRDLAKALAVPRGQVGPWASGAKRVPPKYWAQIRELFGTTAPAPSVERDRVDEALPLVLAAIDAEPGLGRQEVARRVDAPEPHARGAILRALEQGRVHERPGPRTRGDGVLRFMRGLFPGPLPAELPPTDLTSLVVQEVLPEVEALPGRTRRQVALSLPHDRRLAERAISRALKDGLVHERGVARCTGRGARVDAGLFPGSTPPPAASIAGGVLRRLRERLIIGHAELAELLGVTPRLVRVWERSEVPPAWREAVAAALRPVAAEADAREADRRRRIVEAVREQPGMPRWGELPRRLQPVERSHLRQLLEELIAAGKLHERPVENGHGAGLFPGPPPPEWVPGPPLPAAELHAMRDWAGLNQKELAERIGASVASVNAWEQGTKPVPTYRRGQLRRVLAERKPPEPALVPAAELLAERRRIAWSQSRLAEQLGVKQSAVSAWERGARPVPAELRDRLRELFAAAPTLPRVSGAELRRWRRAQGLTAPEVAELLGISRAVAEKWLQRGIRGERAEPVRELLDAEPAQTHLFDAG